MTDLRTMFLRDEMDPESAREAIGNAEGRLA